MNDVTELKQYVKVHARGLEINGWETLLDRIQTDGAGSGSWAGEWTAAGDAHAAEGRPLEASRHYLMARFPFVDGPARQAAYEKCLAEFEQWRQGQDIQRLEVRVGNHRLVCWTSGLAPGSRRPLLLVSGGFLTLKEQWAPALPTFRGLGFAAVATEMPGVGENEVPYARESWRFLPAILDAVAGLADSDRAYLLTLSFSGHQALRCALADGRIRGVATAGAPLREFFTDPDWQRDLPRVTVDTLAHLTGGEPATMADRALTAGQLAALRIPVAYLASARDEVIPPGDLDLLRREVRDLRVLRHDDVHGSPSHTEENKLWLAWSVLRMHRRADPRTLLVGLMWRLAQLRAGFARRRARRAGSPLARLPR